MYVAYQYFHIDIFLFFIWFSFDTTSTKNIYEYGAVAC